MRIEVLGYGTTGDVPLVEHKAYVTFVDKKSLLLRVFLDADCLNAGCDDDKTCTLDDSATAGFVCSDIPEATDLPVIMPGEEVEHWIAMDGKDAGTDADMPTVDGRMPMPEMDGDMPNMPTDKDSSVPAPDGAMPCEKQTFYLDMDSDGDGDPAQMVEECVRPEGYVDNGDDCDDQCSTCFLGGFEVCDGKNNDCDEATDEGTDQNCGIATGACKEGTRYCVNGTYGTCEGEIVPSDEVCEGTIDENCDGIVDEGCACATGTTRPCGSNEGLCVAGTQHCTDGTWESTCANSTGPTRDVCDGKDNDCDKRVDEDDPGVGSACGSTVGTCRAGTQVCQAGMLVCSGETGPAADDTTCDNSDDDCDMKFDEDVANIANKGNSCTVGTGSCARSGVYKCNNASTALICDAVAGSPSTWYRDADDDTFGDPNSTRSDCSPPSGYVRDNTDCNDNSGISYPQATEVCDMLDNDCDGQTNEDFPNLGNSCAVGTGACRRTGTYVCSSLTTTACSAMAGTSSKEVCGDGVDNDCNGQTDEGCPTGLEIGSTMSCIYLSPTDSAGRRPVKCWGTMSLSGVNKRYDSPSLLFDDPKGYVSVQPGKYTTYTLAMKDGGLILGGTPEAPTNVPASAALASSKAAAYGSSAGLYARNAVSGSSPTYAELRPDGGRVVVKALDSGGQYLVALEGNTNRLRVISTSGTYQSIGTVTDGVDVEGAAGPAGSNLRVCALLGNGTISCLGDFVDDELAAGTAAGFSTAPRIASVPNQTFVDVAVTTTAACGLARNGNGQQTVYCWGRSNAATGFSPDPDSPVSGSQSDMTYPNPTRVGVASLGTDIVDIDGGSSHLCALSRSGNVYCWGSNSVGQVGSSFPIAFP